MLLELEDFAALFPRPLELDEEARACALILAAEELIEEEFLRRGRVFHQELEGSRLLQLTVKRVLREMITSAITVGADVGAASVSSTTGPTSDSITYSQGVGIHWGGVYMTTQWLRDLGLADGTGYGHSFPTPKRYAEPVAYRDVDVVAEFAEVPRGRIY